MLNHANQNACAHARHTYTRGDSVVYHEALAGSDVDLRRWKPSFKQASSQMLSGHWDGTMKVAMNLFQRGTAFWGELDSVGPRVVSWTISRQVGDSSRQCAKEVALFPNSQKYCKGKYYGRGFDRTRTQVLCAGKRQQQLAERPPGETVTD
jgi:hypothetical protein